MTDHYLVAHNRLMQSSMDFYLRPEDGVLFVDEPSRDQPFMVEPEAVLALFRYLEERIDVIEQAQKQLIQAKIDLKDMGPPYSEADLSPRFELVEVDEESEGKS